ncbi:MAG: NAD(P)H-dependent oxidoreductase subunit E [Clostridia bacterium]|nr:NAD(P)H-dependent oxidoreductase subunit E [Clostridia bacterium]
MATTISSVPFKDTAEKAAKLQEIIAEHKGKPGALIPVLQKAQEVYGYLPIEVEQKIAEGLDISIEKVYEVVTFYAQFALDPKGEYDISVCLGTACYVKGAGEIFDKLKQKLGIGDGGCTPDGKFSLSSCRCVGACGLAPVVMINGDVYGRLLPDDVDGILAKYSA